MVNYKSMSTSMELNFKKLSGSAAGPIDLKMKVFVLLFKVFISIKLSVKSVWIVLKVKQSVFVNCL